MTIDGQTVGLQVWDTAGQERFLSIGHAYYKGSDCCILTYDVTQPATFANIDGWKSEFEDCIGSRDGKKSVPFILLGNKVDQITDRKVSEVKARNWCRLNEDIPYFETSAKDGTGVRDAFLTAGQIAFKNRSEVQ